MQYLPLAAAAVGSSGGSGGGTGGGDGWGGTPPTDTAAPSLTITPAALSVVSEQILQFTLDAADPAGFTGNTGLTCPQGEVSSTATTATTTQSLTVSFTAPQVTAQTDISCTAFATDSLGNSATLPIIITVTPAPAQPEFNGTWFSPCYNSTNFSSVNQTLTITGSSVVSDINTYTNGINGAYNCTQPSSGILITTDVTAQFSYGDTDTTSGCEANTSFETSVALQTLDTSGNPTVTSEPALRDTFDFVTAYVGLIPSQTNICNLDNGNLLFAGVEYRPDFNTTIVPPVIDLDSDVTWSMGDYDYEGGGSGGSDTLTFNRGALSVSTSQDLSNGLYSGSGIAIGHSLNGSGIYQLTDTLGLVTEDSTLPGTRFIDISVTVGAGLASGAVQYASTPNSGFITVVQDSDGFHHFSTTSPVTLQKGVEVLGGIPGAPSTFSLTMDNVYNLSGLVVASGG